MSDPEPSAPAKRSPRVLTFGAYDTRKPRVRLLIDALRRSGALEEGIYIPAWESVPQTNIPSRLSLVKVVFGMLLGYPHALLRLFRAGRRLRREADAGAVLLPYPGVIEILWIAPFARSMGLTVILDAFLPIYDTIVSDRSLLGKGLIAKMIWLFERSALRRADIIVTDTDSHGAYFAAEFGIPVERFHTILVGAEPIFALNAPRVPVGDILGNDDPRPIVLFYGQLIPLHGVPTIIDAARLSSDDARWVVIGRGQLEPQLKRWIEEGGDNLARRLSWISWVDYEKLPSVIARADLCLGIFGASDKAARVIPNKLFQQAAMGKPIITRESPAVASLARDFPQAIRTVPADDPQALADAVSDVLGDRVGDSSLAPKIAHELSPDAGVARLVSRLGALGEQGED